MPLPEVCARSRITRTVFLPLLIVPHLHARVSAAEEARPPELLNQLQAQAPIFVRLERDREDAGPVRIRGRGPQVHALKQASAPRLCLAARKIEFVF